VSKSHEDSLSELGRTVARAQSDALDVLVQSATTRWRQRRRRLVLRLGAGGLALAAAVMLVVAVRAHPPITATLQGRPLETARWITVEAPTELTFSDGTTLLIDPSSRVRVSALDGRGAVVELERGRLVASVRHAEDTRWTFRVGPYDVLVTGTGFETSWDAGRDRFEIRMTSGSVVARGPRLSAPRTLVAGETLVAEPEREAATSVGGTRGATSEPPVAVPAEGARGTSGAGASTDARGAGSAESQRELDRAFLGPAADGDFAGALAVAEARGFDGLCARLDATSLLRLGDVARYAGDPRRGRDAYTALRRRFASSSDSADAAYALGLAASSPAQAAAFFETYLREAPRGVLAREARGRLMEAYQRAGSEGDARRAAAEYLAHHPDGSLAQLARSIVAR
jgi:hypothetical protein